MPDVTLHLTPEQAENVERIAESWHQSAEAVVMQHLRYSPGSPILAPFQSRGTPIGPDFGDTSNC